MFLSSRRRRTRCALVTGVQTCALPIFFPAKAQTDVWDANPGALMACSDMQTGKAILTSDGYELSGRWRFASGADYADWFLLGARLERAGEIEPVILDRKSTRLNSSH